MIKYNVSAYDAMFGDIPVCMMASARCVSQCTGCICSCRCSCSGGVIYEFEWE